MKSRGAALASSDAQLQALAELPLTREFPEALASAGLHPLKPTGIEIMQINVGKLCNQTCRHCHVDAGPDRRESMTRETMQLCLDALSRTSIPVVDITGGAPELNPDFRWLVERCRELGRHVMDRCNLTILEVPSQRDTPEFLARHNVEVVCSLPHYRAAGTDRQRGDGVFEKSIAALRRLNQLGYGDGVSGLRLVLVTNPVGAFIPGAQASLEREWKRELLRLHGVRFDALYCITNMPISRYLEWLITSENLEGYMERLVNAFNPVAARGVMCRNTISVGWDGVVYDCDFNQMLDLPVAPVGVRHIRDFDVDALNARSIVTDRHCFGCTAGAGSSCGGVTS
ncbi:MAG: arsenosugar biosynthesis radical SAM protein ArsS [Candidatus Krumholzibacteria bacterium]|nr:arsenosugar biosynthesis radical SAM protein ArsS [Candidatus Krumholzibacteria bacterium]MDH4335745.1 arsenosugar biosynthesis radical SAM protein ArsS [Candidatus Krumholzibacteria bacterium]MDH5269271.1 arsenosugar biosynthesis radical SAM protein ArsS [Candidatus Krumholzibacteria bacterium]MDH5628023.1 arsenosugar biosynthesis radical SAM protein ArsS [Candidatus Krumholzibacteria bacterium]